MNKRLAALLVLVIAGLTLASAPASANTPVPGIKQTPAFQKMKGYVEFLSERKDKPVTVAKRKTFRTNLAQYRKNADLKVNQLLSTKLNWISRQDDVQERRQVKRIRVNQRRQILMNQRNLARRIGALKSKQNAAIQRVFNRYQMSINKLADKRDMLKRQRDMATDPVRKANLTRKIQTVQNQINAVVDDRTTDVNAINSRYTARTTSVNDLFNAKAAAIRSRSKKQIQQTRNAWRQTFRTQVAAAKSTRSAEKNLVATVAQRGSGYITAMPPAGN